MSNEHESLQFAWVRNPEQKGKFLFTFDGKQIFNLFRDYPEALTKEQKELFDAQNPYWAEYFKDRTSDQ